MRERLLVSLSITRAANLLAVETTCFNCGGGKSQDLIGGIGSIIVAVCDKPMDKTDGRS